MTTTALVAVMATCLVTGAGACDNGDPPDDRDAAPDGPAGPGLAGLLIDPMGQPRPTTDVLACMATTCLFGESGPDGRFFFPIEPPAEVALKTHHELTRTPRLAAALEPVRIVDDSLVDVGTLYTPELPEGVVIGPATDDPQILAVGDGLELHVEPRRSLGTTWRVLARACRATHSSAAHPDLPRAGRARGARCLRAPSVQRHQLIAREGPRADGARRRKCGRLPYRQPHRWRSFVAGRRAGERRVCQHRSWAGDLAVHVPGDLPPLNVAPTPAWVAAMLASWRPPAAR